MSQLQKIIYLTRQQYETLLSNNNTGQITYGGVTLTGVQDNNIYFITDETVSAADLGDDFVLPVSKGGTGKTQFTSGSLLVGNGQNALTEIGATNQNTANTIVKRDSSGNFSAGDITASSATIGSLQLSTNQIINLTKITNANGYILLGSGISGDGVTTSQWCVGASNLQGVIRTGANQDLLHSRATVTSIIIDTGNWTNNIKYLPIYEARQSTTSLNKSANYVAAGAMFHLVASSSTSATDNGKTPSDANILQMNWDNNGGYDSQLGISTSGQRMYFRSEASKKTAWQEVAHAPCGTSNIGSATQPVYMTSTGVITAGTALKDLAYIAKPSSNTTTTYLRGDGSWVGLSDMGLSSAMHYRGAVSADPTTTTPTGTYASGDVLVNSSNSKEFVYDGTSWREIGDESSFALSGHDHPISISATGTTTVTLAASTTYTLTAGGNSIVFKTPADNKGVTKVSTGAGLTGGDITTTGTISINGMDTSSGSETQCLTKKGTWKDFNNYSLTVSTTSALGGVKVAYQSSQAATVTPATNTTTPTIQARSTSANRSYGIESDKNGVLFVTVPWTNVNSSYLTSSSSLAWSKLTGVPTASTTTAGIIKIGTTESDAAAGNHAHGNISNTGTISTSAAIVNNDALVIAAATTGTVKKTSIVFDGSTTSQALTKKGTWGTFLTAHGSSYGKIASGAVSTTVTSISANTATIESKSANEKLTIQAGNKWIQTGVTNSNTAGSDVITLGHFVPASAISNLSTTAQTPAFGNTFNIPTINLDEAGHVTSVSNATVKIPELPSSMTPSAHTHGNISNTGTLGTTASYGVATDANKKIIAIDLTVNDPAASGNATTFVTSVTQSSQGKISVSRSTVPNASSTTAGIVKLGADGGAATYSHTHSGYLTTHGKSYGGIQVSAQSTTSVALASSSAATTVTAVGANETVKFVTKNKWIVIKGVNSATAGADEVQFAHTAGLTAKTSYCSTSATASANGGKITVTDIQYDEAGHITSTTDRTITLSQTTYSLSSLGAASSTHTHGNISNTGTISTSAAPVNGDAIVISTSANGGLVKKTNITFDGSTTSSYLNKKGDWGTPPDTKNTAGSTATATKIFLIGATAQSASPQTYSTTFVYATDGVMSAEAFGINHATTANKVTLQWNNTDSSLDFVFA